MTINVTKPFLPEFEKYTGYLRGVWERQWLTNRGPLVLQLEEELKSHLGLNHLLFVSNGTIALQIAIKALALKGEIITTPFSYVATTTSILWENCAPVFVDIDSKNFCIDASLIENAITDKTTAILATHVYGFPCAVEEIEAIASRHNLKVIYDAAHAFGVTYKDKSLLSYGDISTCSFHATKVFHTGEGGAIISNIPELNDRIFHYHTFGHLGDEYFEIGINGKNSEFHAAMGLCNLTEIDRIISGRKNVYERYVSLLLDTKAEIPVIPEDTQYNYAYFPVLYKNEEALLKVKNTLADQQINTRRYFYPSLNQLPYIENKKSCPVSENIASRVLCLPLYFDLDPKDAERICKIIKTSI